MNIEKLIEEIEQQIIKGIDLAKATGVKCGYPQYFTLTTQQGKVVTRIINR